MISTVIAVSKNEIELLDGCIDSIIGLSDEIIVFNLTGEKLPKTITSKYVFKTIEHESVNYIEKIRWKMVDSVKHDWVLILDPDERIPISLYSVLEDISRKDEYSAVNLPRQNIFFGKWIAHTNWWPDKQIRFFRKKNVTWPNVIHTYPEIKGRVYEMPAKKEHAIIHYGYSKLSEFVERQNRYSDIEAQNLFNKRVRFSKLRFFFEPLKEFLRRYIWHAGFLDGIWGFVLSYLMAMYKLSIWIKIWEKQKGN